MSDLPTREAWGENLNDPEIAFGIADAYLHGVLMTREEFIDSIDVVALAWSVMFDTPMPGLRIGDDTE